MLTLVPAFNPDTVTYTAVSANNTNKIVVVPEDADAAVVIESDDAVIAADGTATWKAGENVVTITVTNGAGVDEVDRVYTVTVTKS